MCVTVTLTMYFFLGMVNTPTSLIGRDKGLILPRLGWPDGVEGVVAADDDVVERSPRPASKWTQSSPLTPPARSPPPLSPRELSRELVELGVPTVGGFSILYLRNSEQKRDKYAMTVRTICNRWH